MGLQYPDLTAVLLTEVPEFELWPCLQWLTIAHVKDSHLIPLLYCYSTVAGNSVVPAATVPLARMDLEFPGEAPVQDKSSSLVVFILSAHSEDIQILNWFNYYGFLRHSMFSIIFILPAIKCDYMWVSQRVTNRSGNVLDRDLRIEVR